MSIVIGLDVGTSGGRAVVCDAADGHVLASASRDWRYRTDADGFPELDSQTVWASLASASRDAIRACMARADAIAAVGITSQRTGIVLTDAKGKVLHAGPNADPRGVQHGVQMERDHGERIYATTGRLPAMLYLPARLAWFRANRASVLDAATHALSLGDWASFAMTGEAATDRTQAAETLCYSLAGDAYDDDLCEQLGVPRTLLPPVASEPLGVLLDTAAHDFGIAAGTPVVRAGADTQNAALATGRLEPGSVIVPAGTTMPVQQVIDAATLDPERRLWTSPHVAPDRYVLEAHCGEAGPSVDWLLSILERDYGWLDKAAAAAPPGAGGVHHVDTGPTNMGDYPLIRSGGFAYPIPVMMLGRTRDDLARATLEGIAFAVRASLEWLTGVSGLDAGDVALCGGLSQSRTLCGIVASVLGRSVRRAKKPQSSALGAAIVAAHAAGLHASVAEAAARMGDAGDPVEPDAAAMPVYDGLYPGWLATRARYEEARMKISDLKDVR